MAEHHKVVRQSDPFRVFRVFRGLERAKRMAEILFKEESYAIVGACFNVYKDKGSGFLEPVYHECCEIEFAFQKIPFLSQTELELTYRGQILRQRYKPDFICFQQIIVELKAVSALADEHRAQLLNYLSATKMKLGLLVNFGHHPKLEYERIVLGTAHKTHEPHESAKRTTSGVALRIVRLSAINSFSCPFVSFVGNPLHK